MINLFYVPGMFGSTLEYVLSNYTHEHIPITAEICRDGSLHSYYKQAHVVDIESLAQLINNKKLYKITTPIYPWKQLHLPEILSNFNLTDDDHNVLMYAESLTAAELNMLFQYHKVAFGEIAPKGLDFFSGNNSHNIKNWNSNYTSWDQMQSWEWREWFSLFYVSWIQEWLQSASQVPEYFLKIKNTDLLFDTENTINCIIEFCGLTIKPELDQFINNWLGKQQYIVDEFELLDQIIDSTITQRPLTWQPISIVAEAIVQQRLRAIGYEMRCDGLDTFPTDSRTLYNLLEKY
jgi:hypothetical protein